MSTSTRGATRRAWLVPLVAVAALVAGLLAAPAVQAIPVAAGTFWTDPSGLFDDCTQARPCTLDQAVVNLNAAGGGTIEVLGDASNPYTVVRADFSAPATIEA